MKIIFSMIAIVPIIFISVRLFPVCQVQLLQLLLSFLTDLKTGYGNEVKFCNFFSYLYQMLRNR